MTLKNPGWPAVLTRRDITLRPYRRSDAARWSRLRRSNEAWLAPWEPSPGQNWYKGHSTAAYKNMLRVFKKSAKAGTTWPFAICVNDEIVGGITVGNIVRRAFCNAYVGYWIDQGHAGRGITTTALALVIDHALTTGRLHRLEVNIRPENEPSNRVAEKLSLRKEGFHSKYLYIDGAWRDHYGYAVTVEDLNGERMVDRLERRRDSFSFDQAESPEPQAHPIGE